MTSQLPWKVGSREQGSFENCVYGEDFWFQVQANAANPFTEAEVLNANASFIVKACNNHERLIKAVSNFKELIDNCIKDKQASELIKKHYTYLALQQSLQSAE